MQTADLIMPMDCRGHLDTVMVSVFFLFPVLHLPFFPALIHPYTQISRYSEYVRILVCTDTNNNNNNQICMAP